MTVYIQILGNERTHIHVKMSSYKTQLFLINITLVIYHTSTVLLTITAIYIYIGNSGRFIVPSPRDQNVSVSTSPVATSTPWSRGNKIKRYDNDYINKVFCLLFHAVLTKRYNDLVRSSEDIIYVNLSSSVLNKNPDIHFSASLNKLIRKLSYRVQLQIKCCSSSMASEFINTITRFSSS